MADESRIGICDDHPIVRGGIRSLLDRTPDLRLVLEVERLAGLHEALGGELELERRERGIRVAMRLPRRGRGSRA